MAMILFSLRVTFCVFSMRPHFSLFRFLLSRLYFCVIWNIVLYHRIIIFFHSQIYPIFLLLCFFCTYTQSQSFVPPFYKAPFAAHIKRTSLWLCYNLRSTFNNFKTTLCLSHWEQCEEFRVVDWKIASNFSGFSKLLFFSISTVIESSFGHFSLPISHIRK